MKTGLTEKQSRFVEEYLLDVDPVAAATRAGYRSPARSAASLMERDSVQQAIKEAMRNRCDRTGVSQDRVVEELAAIGFSAMTDLCEWSGEKLTLKPSATLNSRQAATVAEIIETTTSRGGTVRLKLHSKMKALEMLAKHVGLYDSRPDDSADELSNGGSDAGRETNRTQSRLQNRLAGEIPEVPLSPEIKARLNEMYGRLEEDC